MVEGQRETALKLQRVFAEHGHVVDVAFNGVDGLHLAAEGAHDLLVVGDHAADFSGLQLLSEVKRHRQVSVILISEEDSVDERVRSLRMGAHDYLVKPFAFSELLARVQALGQAATVPRATG